MATYVNDLRLKEIGTGESSGTWGTESNVNLELIGEALGYGSEGITTNADTHTSTVADGATDPVRAMFVKYTGSLDSACTITIAPNTVSRMQFIENGTSGSQNIIISQGSGANITIPPGDVKAVYLDGAGSGAAVVDAFASLNVVDLKVEDDLTVTDDLIVNGDIDLEGSIDVNGTSNLDVVDIDGAVNMATTALVTGVLTTTATQVATGGITSGSDIISDTDSTDSLGSTGVRWLKGWFDTLTAGTLTIGSGSVTDSSGAISFGNENLTTTGVGTFASLDISGDIDVDGTSNLDVVDIDGATQVDATITVGVDDTGYDVKFFGATSGSHLLWDESADNLKLVGGAGLTIAGDISSTTAGTSNFRAGVNAGNSIASGGNYNLCVGDEAGAAINTGDNNVAVGYAALDANSTGSQNIAIGTNALGVNTTANNNVAVGYNALDANLTGTQNIAVGYSALSSNTTANSNIAVGTNALTANTTGDLNTAVGENVIAANIEGSKNSAFGYAALDADTYGNQSTALGYAALSAQNFTSSTASQNVAVGHNAGTAVTTGVQNTLIGAHAGDALTDADNNVAVGYQSLGADTLGSHATAIGRFALNAQNFTSATSSYNVGVGYQAGKSITVGLSNTIVGSLAGDALTDADFNVIVGRSALGADTLGSRSVALGYSALSTQNFTSATNAYNVAAGYNAGKAVTTGLTNTLIGSLCHDNLTTGDLNTAIGYNLAPSAVDVDSEIVIGSSITGAGTNTVRIGTGGGTATLGLDGSDTSWAAASDSRLKKDVADSTAGLEFINDLRPITFKWNAKNEVAQDLPQYDVNSSAPIFGEGKAHHGFIAQEVKAVIDDHSDVLDGNNIWHEDPDGTQELSQGNLVPMLVKAVQELSAKIAELEAKSRCKCNGE